MLRVVVLIACVLAAPMLAIDCQAQTPAAVRYTVLMMGKAAGAQTTLIKPDGVREFTFEYNDRGRGPLLTSRIKVDPQGLPVAVETSGNDYMKAEVKETFTLTNGLARWKNDGESGEKKLSAPAFYINMQSVPEQSAALARALLESSGRRLALLPDGEASIRQTSELTLTQNARTLRVRAYEITGLGFTPGTVWLDENNEFFAEVSSWLTTIREGWESSAPRLLADQDAIDAKRTMELARSLTRQPAAVLAITNARLFDAETGQSNAGSTVLIDGNRITAVGKDGTVTIPANAERIDAHGKALLPGLWDMHVHIGPNEGLMHIAAGVTSVRDLANDHESLQAILRAINAGEEIGPRIVTTGFIDGRGPYAGPTKVFADTEAESRAAIDNYAKLGYEGIKIYSSIKPELVPALIEQAHARGLRLSGHVPAFMTAQQFVEAGADELQHINFVFLNFFFDEVKDTRTPARFVAVAERAGSLDLNSDRVRSFVSTLRTRGVVVDPTVSIFEGLFTDRPGTMALGYAPVADRLPPQVRRELLAGGLAVPEGKDQAYRQSSQALLRMIKLLYDNGVTLVAGTDSMPGFTLHRELELYVAAGIPAREVLRIATLGAARVTGRDKELGTIAPGKLADLILVDGDPALRISDIRRTSLVLKDGKIFDPATLYGSIGVRAR